MILIVGQHADPHVASVVASLRRCGKDFTVLDFYSASSDGLQQRISTTARLRTKGTPTSLDKFNAIWWRQKPKMTVSTETTTAFYDYFFIKQEWKQLTDYLSNRTAGIFSINDPQKAAEATNKLTHLRIGEECGFDIPDTLVSNDVDIVVDFMDSLHGRRFIYKPLTPYMPPTGLVTFTSEITADLLLRSRDAISAAPGIFQVFVEKQFELRVTVVGEELFAVKINSHFSPETEVDWRLQTSADMYSKFELDDALATKLIVLHRTLGLFYAAYDFIIDRSGTPYLLDVNPAGQWMWLETNLGFPIGERIAAALASPLT